MFSESGRDDTVPWRTIRKEVGKFYLAIYFIIMALGFFIILISVWYYLYYQLNDVSGLIVLLIVGFSFIGWSIYLINQKGPNSAITQGVLRFNSEIIEFISEKNGIRLQIPMDEKIKIYPIVGNALLRDLVGITIVRGKVHIDIEPGLGYSRRDIQNGIPTLIYFAKERNVKFDKIWKHVKY